MRRRKAILFVLCFSLLLLIGMTANIFTINSIEEVTETNTTAFMATVSSKTSSDDKATVERNIIYTEEYYDKIRMDSIYKNLDVSDLESILPGQIVYFRIMNAWLDQFEEMDFVYIVSLKTEEKEIVTLSCYNEYREGQNFTATFVCSVIIAISIVSFAYCVITLKKSRIGQ